MKRHRDVELLAYLDGELSPEERARVEAHLAECPACREELARLEALSHDLDVTFEAALDPIRLPGAAETRIRETLRARLDRPRGWWFVRRNWGLLVQAVMALLVVIAFIGAYPSLELTRERADDEPPLAPQEMLVLGQERLAPGSRGALRVVVRSTDTLLPVTGAAVTISLRAGGTVRQLFSGLTGPDGTTDATFAVPPELEGRADLIVETTSAAGTERIVRPIEISRSYKLLLTLDKPAYRPGQTLHLRALALDALDLRPATSAAVVFEILDPDGERIVRAGAPTSDFGIASFDFDLPESAPSGDYRVRALLGDTLSQRTLLVDDYELPPFRVSVETGQDFYAPEARVTGTVEARHFYGEPLTGTTATLYAYSPDGIQIAAVTGETGPEGRFDFAFNLPRGLAEQEPALVTLEAVVVTEEGDQAGIRDLLPVAPQPILIRAVPGSDELKAGVENSLFLLTSYPDGRPAPATLVVSLGDDERVLETGPYGLAELRFTPERERVELVVTAEDASGATGEAELLFEADALPTTLLLRAERATYEVGETLRMEALTAGLPEGTPVYLDVVRENQMVAALSAPVETGRALFALDLDATLAGSLDLRAYAFVDGAYAFVDGESVGDHRWVVVDPARGVDVEIRADRERYPPGETARLTFTTTLTPTGEPIPAALGISVVDASVYALETAPAAFARLRLLLDQELLAREGALPLERALVEEARDQAAEAAWAGAPGTDFTLEARAALQPADAPRARGELRYTMVPILLIIPLLLTFIVAQGLAVNGVLRRSLRRLGVGLILLTLIIPILALVLVGGAALLNLTGALLALTLLAVVGLLLVVAAHGWYRRDARVQSATGLLTAYLVVGGLLVWLTARGAALALPWIVLIAATYLLLVAGLALLGQGLVLSRHRLAGWLTTALALLLVLLALLLPLVPALRSPLTRTLGDPTLYAGPAGWLTGCAPAPTIVVETVEIETEGETVIVTVVASPTPEPPAEEEAEATEEPIEVTEEPGADDIPTAAPTATPAAPPPEPYPFRLVVPETLYWNPEALTGEEGIYLLQLALPETFGGWRVTALASTRDGEIGSAVYDLPVFTFEEAEGP
ncbi:MAG: MG2 domain-containing protein [Anaerolineales bacterium]